SSSAASDVYKRQGLPVERIAEMTKVSAYELITRLTSRVAMKYVD
ncbi:hypothetical protein ACX3VG_31290, partial [Escherichia coli]